MHRSLFHVSKRSRDQLKAHVLMYHHRLPSPDLSLVSNTASTKSLAFWRIANGMVGARVTNWNDGQRLAKNRLHWEDVKHLAVTLALINNTGSAVQHPVCNRRIILEVFSII